MRRIVGVSWQTTVDLDSTVDSTVHSGLHSGLESGLGLTAHSWQNGGDSTVDHGHKLNPFPFPKKQKPTLFYLEKVIMSGFRTPIGIGIAIPH